MKRQFIFLFIVIVNQANCQNKFDSLYLNSSRESINKIKLEFNDDYGNKTFLPLTVIKGKDKGIVFTILAGVHGAEYAPIIATQKLIKKLEVNRLSGTIIILPITNIGAFYSSTPYVNPIDNLNINRIFPGNKNGSVSEKIAHFISTKIIPLSDVFLDAHSGDANEDLLPFVCYYDNQNHPFQTKMAKELSEYSGFENVISYPYTIKDSEPALYAFKQASQVGKIALSFESGKLGYLQPKAIDRILRGYNRIFDKLKMYEYNDPVEKTKFKRLNSPYYIKSKFQGILYTGFKAGEKVPKNSELGFITDEFGEIIEKYFASKSGTILYMKGTPPVNIGDTVFSISPN
tara:strand:+ start:3790 stop:4827 length:1038 start_codon:yes stop_codon:yes gene_type:complete